MSPTEIRDYLQKKGYRAQLKEDDDGSSSIDSGTNGIPFSILFYPDEDGGDLDAFESVSFLAGMETDKPLDLSTLNTANTNNRFVRVFREDDTIWFQMDVPLSSITLNEAAFDETFSNWNDWFPELIREAGN